MSMIAGKYYVGDLCYVMDDEEWNEVCSIIIQHDKCIDGEFTLKDGRRFAMYSTAYGDGTYYDEQNRAYSVDSGSIGCILESDIKAENNLMYQLNNSFHTFEKDFNTSSEKGLIKFGGVVIDTDPPFEEEDEFDEDDL